MLDKEIISHKRVLAELDFDGNLVFYKVGLVIAVDRIFFALLNQKCLLVACRLLVSCDQVRLLLLRTSLVIILFSKTSTSS